MLIPLSGYPNLVLLVIRLILGSVMLYYGWPKFNNPKSNAKDFDKMGYRPGWLFGWIAILIEFFGAFAVISGVLYWLPALGFGIEMIMGATWKITRTNKGFGDWSYDLILFSLCLTLLCFGPGSIAIKV